MKSSIPAKKKQFPLHSGQFCIGSKSEFDQIASTQNQMENREYIEAYNEITTIFIEFGWIVPPFLIGKDFRKAHELAMKIRVEPALTPTENEAYREEIGQLLTGIIFHPLHRAFFVQRAKEVNHVKEFSHHLERATMHYFKNDYFSTVLCLLPAIEGSLLSYYGWTHGSLDSMPKSHILRQEIRRCRVPTNDQEAYEAYSKSLSRFLEKWVFTNTASADFSHSFLNRHYALHGMGNGNYYTLEDAQRLIVFFDLFIEFLSAEQDIFYPFIPESDIDINRRCEYYFALIRQMMNLSEGSSIEMEFLNQNSNYFAETNPPDWTKIEGQAINEFFEFIGKHFPKPGIEGDTA